MRAKWSEIRRGVQHEPQTFVMTLSEKQRKSTMAVSEWICCTYDERGYELTFGDVAHTKAQHALYLKDGKAQIMHSKSMNR